MFKIKKDHQDQLDNKMKELSSQLGSFLKLPKDKEFKLKLSFETPKLSGGDLSTKKYIVYLQLEDNKKNVENISFITLSCSDVPSCCGARLIHSLYLEYCGDYFKDKYGLRQPKFTNQVKELYPLVGLKLLEKIINDILSCYQGNLTGDDIDIYTDSKNFSYLINAYNISSKDCEESPAAQIFDFALRNSGAFKELSTTVNINSSNEIVLYGNTETLNSIFNNLLHDFVENYEEDDDYWDEDDD